MEKVTEIAEFGCTVMAQYAVFGQCDLATIVEASDNATVTHPSVDLRSRGTVNIITLPAIPVANARQDDGPKQMGGLSPRVPPVDRPSQPRAIVALRWHALRLIALRKKVSQRR
jgi:GYD domain